MEARIFVKAVVYSSTDQFKVLLTKHLRNKSAKQNVRLNQKTVKVARYVGFKSVSQLE